MRNRISILLLVALTACQYPPQTTQEEDFEGNVALALSIEQAERLTALPMKCLEQEYPNKLNQVLGDSTDLQPPSALHPAFYGCFDWHSSVHGTWMMARLMREFPKMEQDTMRQVLSRLLTTENILTEVAYFESKHNKNFERTYGWAWMLKLHGELLKWEDSLGQALSENVEPLADFIADKFMEFLPKLQQPLRSGEHVNTAFGLSMAYDYAKFTEHKQLKALIESRARDYFLQDKGANLAFEPSGFDFLSPIFEEINLMRKVLPRGEFLSWLKQFLPSIYDKGMELRPLKVADRSDGKLVHLDGLNMSRAWCLYAISGADKSLGHLKILADKHLEASLPQIVDGEYMGEHWLASFALHALLERERIR